MTRRVAFTFDRCTTRDGVRAKYRKLAKKHHPDQGGEPKTMREINTAYQAALARVEDSLEIRLRNSLTPEQQSHIKTLHASERNGMVSVSMEWTGDVDMSAFFETLVNRGGDK